MAGENTSQITAAAAAPTNGNASASEGSTATTTGTTNLNPLDAALEEAFGGGAGDAGSQDGDQAQAGASGGDGQGTDNSDGSGTQDGDGNDAGQGNGDGAEGGEDGADKGDKEGNGNDAELPEEIDPENPPKGMENLPKPVWKRIQKQSAQIKSLKEELNKGSVKLTPSELNPLAHVRTVDELKGEIATARGIKQWLGSIPEDQWTEKDGVRSVQVKIHGQVFELSEQQIADKMARAEAALDPEAFAAQHDYITKREAAKPWVEAEKIVPGLLTKGTDANKAYLEILQQAPELASRLPNFEVILAFAVKGQREYDEEKAGKAKMVRMEMKDGKPVMPKAAEKPGSAPAKPTTTAPATARPPVQTPQGTKKTAAQALAALPKEATQDQRLDAALEEMFG